MTKSCAIPSESGPSSRPHGRSCEGLIQARIWPLDLTGAAHAFGPVLATKPTDWVLPAFELEGAATSGIFATGTKPKWHVDVHAVADLGYVQIYYNADGTTIAAPYSF